MVLFSAQIKAWSGAWEPRLNMRIQIICGECCEEWSPYVPYALVNVNWIGKEVVGHALKNMNIFAAGIIDCIWQYEGRVNMPPMVKCVIVTLDLNLTLNITYFLNWSVMFSLATVWVFASFSQNWMLKSVSSAGVVSLPGLNNEMRYLYAA